MAETNTFSFGDADLDAFLNELVIEKQPAVPEAPVAVPQRYPKITPEVVKCHTDGMLVTQTEYPFRRYEVFESAEHFFSYTQALPEEQRCYHEVIVGDGPRNIYLDLDGHGIPEAEYPTILNEATRGFKQAVLDYWGFPLENYDLSVISACGFSATKQENKFSLHIRTRFLAATPDEIAAFSKFYAGYLSRPDIVDFGVYKKTQQVRMLGSTKKGDARHSKLLRPTQPSDEPLSALDEFKASLIGYERSVSRFLAPKKLAPKPAAAVVDADPDNETIKWILDNTKQHYTGYGFRQARGSHLYFLRFNPPACDICGRAHDSDNALFMTVHADHVTKSCHRDANKTQVRILDLPTEHQGFIVAPPPAAPAVKLTSEERLQKLIDAPYTAPQLDFSKGFKQHKTDEYSEPKMRPYDFGDSGTVVIKAQKGVGKTEALANMIREQYQGKTIVALSHRRTFAAELTRHLPGFKNYENIGTSMISMLTYPRTIVQVESLWRLDLDELIYHDWHVDLLIMDESESIIEQLGSGLSKKFSASWDVFNYLTRHSRQVVAIDANMTDRTLAVLADREPERPSPESDLCVFVHNTYQHARDFEYQLTATKEEWRLQLNQDLKDQHTIVIPINSATEAKTLYKDIVAMHPEHEVKLYTGETNQAEKQADIENIDEAWNTCTVLIYTPTITSGVSFKLDRFDKIYAWFESSSCSVLACDQMMGRVRSISTKSAVVYLSPQGLENRQSPAQIRNSMLASRENLYNAYGGKWVAFETTREGLTIYNQRYFDVCVMNTAAMNRTRSNLMGEFVQLLKTTGAKVTRLPITEPDMEIEDIHKMSGREVKREKLQRVVDAPDIDDKEFEELKEKTDKTPDEHAKLHRAYLRKWYSWEGEIDRMWVDVYDDDKAKTVYRNLNTIKDKTLDEIQAEEREHHKQHEQKAGNWNKTYRFEHHRIAQSMLLALGFTGISDKSVKTPAELEAAIDQNKAQWSKEFEKTTAALKLRSKRPNFETLKTSLAYLNCVFVAVYGTKIKAGTRKKGERGEYALVSDHPFDIVTYQPREAKLAEDKK